jgi:hypothetical protein
MASFIREDQPEAAPVRTNVTINVLRAPLVITVADRTRRVGQGNPDLMVSYQGFVAGDTAGDLDVPVEVKTTADLQSGPGDYAIVASGAADTNYVITYVDGTLTVLPSEPPITLSIVEYKVGAGFLVSSSAPPGRRLMIQASTNFVDWRDLTTVTNELPSFRFADPEAATLRGRFYRAKVID